MTATIAKLKSHFADWRNWELNPIVVKELRQAVRNKILTVILMFLLVLLFSISLAVLARRDLSMGKVTAAGRGMFDGCIVVLMIGSLVFTPLYTAIRLALEQYQTDLILFTPLPPTKLIRGKVLSGMYLAGLFFSVCTPFMTFSYLLRGVDWLVIGYVLLVLLFSANLTVLAATAIAVLPFPKFPKIFCGLFFLGVLAVFYGRLLFSFFAVVESGIVPLFSGSQIFSRLFLRLALFATLTIISYGLAVSFVDYRSLQFQSESKLSND